MSAITMQPSDLYTKFGIASPFSDINIENKMLLLRGILRKAKATQQELDILYETHRNGAKFTCEITFRGNCWRGSGREKEIAQEEAAGEALQSLIKDPDYTHLFVISLFDLKWPQGSSKIFLHEFFKTHSIYQDKQLEFRGVRSGDGCIFPRKEWSELIFGSSSLSINYYLAESDNPDTTKREEEIYSRAMTALQEEIDRPVRKYIAIAVLIEKLPAVLLSIIIDYFDYSQLQFGIVYKSS